MASPTEASPSRAAGPTAAPSPPRRLASGSSSPASAPDASSPLLASRSEEYRLRFRLRPDEEEDRLSSLPDDLLHCILRGLPLKHAVRTSALSRRWAPQWLRALATSKVLDLTDPDFARGQSPARAAATVRRCLELHAEHGTPLDVFRVSLISSTRAESSSDAAAFRRDVVRWIASAVARGAREVEVDLDLTPPPTEGAESQDADGGSMAAFVELPGDLFVAMNSLARLALGGFSLRAVPAAPAGLAGLRSLSLSHADVTGEEVGGIVSSCRTLEHLSLRSCGLLKSIRIASETLRVLEMVRCTAVEELRVAAPALESIALHGDIFFYVYDEAADELACPVDLGSTPALRDAYLSEIRFGHIDERDELFEKKHRLCGCDAHTYDYENLLSGVAHAPVWTLSSEGWMQEGNICDLSMIDMTNLQELQLLIISFKYEYLGGFACFFERNRLPILDRLFIRFPSHVTDASDADAAEALASEVVDATEELEIFREFVLDSLSFIKLVNFRGTMFELQLLDFILKRAPALEHLVLVTVGEEGGAPGPGDEHLEVIQRRVSAIQMASSHARLTVCRSSQDRSKNPVHMRIYHQE